MDIVFNWNLGPEPAKQQALEDELSGIIEDREIKPCHAEAMLVSLAMNGALDHRLEGTVKCQCGKTLMTFNGDSSASHLEIQEFKQ